MSFEWKQKGYDWLRAVLWAACGIVPIPFGAFASDRPYIAAASILVFFILSFAVPLWLGYRRRKLGRYDDYASAGATFYGGSVALIVAVGLLNGLIGLALWHSYWGRVFLFTLWMLLTLAAQYGAAKGIDFWYSRLRRYWYSQFLDPILFSLPLPCAVLGMFLFPAFSDESASVSLFIGIMAIMGFCFLAISIFVIATFAFYFFPYKRYGYSRKEKIVHLLSIVVMVLLWVMVQNLLFNSNIQVFGYIFKAMPILQNNPLVFVTPFLLSSLVIIGCVALRNVVVETLS